MAELLPDPGPTALELAPMPAPRGLGLPPGSVPIEPVRAAIRRYRAGHGSADQLTASVDRHGDALEAEIGRLVVAHLADFERGLARLEALHSRTCDLLAQAAWLRGWPCEADQSAVPMSIRLGAARVAIPVVLEALRAAAHIDDRFVQGRRRRRPPGPRGAAASMAALRDECGLTAADVAQAVGVGSGAVWKMLNGYQRVSPALRQGLERLVGPERAELVLAGVPVHPRARAPASAAVRALDDAGVRTEDVAALIPVQPGTLRRWLRGTLRPSPKLAGALEQLVGAEAGRTVLDAIPHRPRTRQPPSELDT
jgi:transcriptional regulator with XRE-family HTH domain